MPLYLLKISNDRETEIEIEASDEAEAMSVGYNAMALFVCRNFPPPESISIRVVDANRTPVGCLKMTFEMETAVRASLQ
tara:strand:+ start:4087 stop:4323 length:237 start_codon:yes stop_codon:yes gene_type:complete